MTEPSAPSLRLSSEGTVFYKVIFPAVWLTAAGVATLIVALSAGAPPQSKKALFFLPFGGLVGLGIFAWLCFPLKEVSLVSGALVVEGLRRKTTIPLSEIKAVSGSIMRNPETITVELKHPCIFGAEIQFMPSSRFVRFSAHPTLTMLSELVAAQAKAIK